MNGTRRATCSRYERECTTEQRRPGDASDPLGLRRPRRGSILSWLLLREILLDAVGVRERPLYLPGYSPRPRRMAFYREPSVGFSSRRPQLTSACGRRHAGPDSCLQPSPHFLDFLATKRTATIVAQDLVAGFLPERFPERFGLDLPTAPGLAADAADPDPGAGLDPERADARAAPFGLPHPVQASHPGPALYPPI